MDDATDNRFEAILEFWFTAEAEALWFKTDAGFDQEIRDRFRADREAAAAGDLAAWETGTQGALALVLLLDQFPRNMFRDSARAFATDDAALASASRAIHRGFDRALLSRRRQFLFLPFQHSESIAQQRRSVDLFRGLDDPEKLDYAERHLAVIERFGRFPHRNRVLGRAGTPEEEAFLAGPNAPF